MSEYRMSNHQLDGDSFEMMGGGNVGVLLMHGLTATTTEVRLLAERLHAAGYDIIAPLLPGHGKTPQALDSVRYEDWLQTAVSNYHHLATTHEYVFVGGESTGGVLALALAARYPDIAGVLCYAPALKLQMPFFMPPLISLGALLRIHYQKPESDGNPYWQGYEVQPLAGVRALLRLNKDTSRRLPNIRQPVLVMQGRGDTTVAPDCGEVIRDGVKTAVFEQHWLENSGHVILVEDEIDTAADLTIRFIKAIVNC